MNAAIIGFGSMTFIIGWMTFGIYEMTHKSKNL